MISEKLPLNNVKFVGDIINWSQLLRLSQQKQIEEKIHFAIGNKELAQKKTRVLFSWEVQLIFTSQLQNPANHSSRNQLNYEILYQFRHQNLTLAKLKEFNG